MEFQIPKIVHEEVEDNRGMFVIEPLIVELYSK